MSVVLVTGGTGVLGRHVVARLRERGDEVRVLSRRPGGGTHVGDLRTGVGVADAARGVELVVHAASDTPFGRADLEQATRLLDVAGDARHLLYVSIVGIDQIPFLYYRRKFACEQRIASGGIPYTILRATQFHELIASVVRSVERLPLVPLPVDFRFQTVAAADVAQRVAELIGGKPASGILNFGGPEVLSFGEMAEAWKAVRGRPRRVVRLPLPGKVAGGFREGLNTCPELAAGRQTWAEFVASQLA